MGPAHALVRARPAKPPALPPGSWALAPGLTMPRLNVQNRAMPRINVQNKGWVPVSHGLVRAPKQHPTADENYQI